MACAFAPAFEQPLHEHAVAVRGGQRQRRLAVFVDGVGLGAGIEQRFGHRPLTEVHRPRERRRAVGLCGVDVGLRANQRGEGFLIAALDRVEHAQIFVLSENWR